MSPKGAVQELAPAKINLTLHVTGQRPDGYHLLDSLVVFADFGDLLTIAPAEAPSLTLTGPLSAGLPTDDSNLVRKAMAFAGWTGAVTLEKRLPAAAGIGGGSSDAAATLRGLARLLDAPLPDGTEALGADVPVCLAARAARMQGVGEVVTPLPALPPLHAVLVNPGIDIPTPVIFRALTAKTNPPMPVDLPDWPDAAALIDWLHGMRNDLEPAALSQAPEVGAVLDRLRQDKACLLARMSGSGATCFALTDTRQAAEEMADRLSDTGWWVQPVTLA